MHKNIRSALMLTFNSICKIFLEIFVFDRKIRRILKGKLAKSYLKKYVNKANKIYQKNNKTARNSNTIWQYWEDGLENAPVIVKQCIKSVEENKNNLSHIVLDKDSVNEYIDIPHFIVEMHKKGLIKSAHFSDYIRVALLSKYGGIWIDSTVFLTKELPSFIYNSDFFVFQNELDQDLDGLNIANYFIASKPHNEFIEKMKLILEMYWKENNFANNYFFFLHALTLITQSTNDLKKQFSKIPFFSFIQIQYLQNIMREEFNEEKWIVHKEIVSINKLSFKNKTLGIKDSLHMKGSFLEKLLQGELK